MAEAQRQEADMKFGALEQKLMDVLDLAEDKLETMRPLDIVMEVEVPVVRSLEVQKNTLILQKNKAWKTVDEIIRWYSATHMVDGYNEAAIGQI